MHKPLRFVAATSHGFKISYQYWIKGKPLPVVGDYYFSENLDVFTVIELAQQ